MHEDKMQSQLSWEEIAQHYAPHIRAAVQKRAGYIGAYVDDVVQDVLIRLNVLRERGKLPANLDEINWLVRKITNATVDNTIRKMGRLSKIGKTTVDGNIDPASEAEMQDLDQTRPKMEVLNELVEQLPDDLREIVQLRLQGLTMQQIAERLGITKNCVNKRERRAHELMRASNSRGETKTCA